MGRALSTVIVGLVVGTGAGATCQGPTGPGRDLDEAAHLWASAGPTGYAYTLRETCFCPPGGRRIEVVDGQVVAVERLEDTDPGRVLEGYTVEQLFELIRESLARDPDDAKLAFDPVAGYPTRIYFDYEYQAVDEEWGFIVQDFETLPR